jgi:hypothetical protein
VSSGTLGKSSYLVLDFFQTLAEAVTLWFEPALEFPNDYLEMERLSFEVREKMLRVSPSSSDARSDTRII